MRRSRTTAHRAKPAHAPTTDMPHVPALAQPVSPRSGAVVDRTIVHLTGDAAVKDNVFPCTGGAPDGQSNLQTQLRVGAWVRNLAFAKTVWLDAHLFDHEGRLLHAETLSLRFRERAADGGDLFEFDGVIYQGSVATAGGFDERPDVRGVQYRLYCEQESAVYTDGLRHWCELRTDAASG